MWGSTNDYTGSLPSIASIENLIENLYDTSLLKVYADGTNPTSEQRKSKMKRGFRIPKYTYIPYPFWHKFPVFRYRAFSKELLSLSYQIMKYKLILKGAYSRKFNRVRKKRVQGRKVRIF